VCVPLHRIRIHIREQRGWRKQASLAYMRRTAPAYSVTQHPQHTYIHRHTHAHTHVQVTCEIHAQVHTAIVYYDSMQLTSSIHKAKDKGHRAHGQKEMMHAYGPKSTPIDQDLVEDINAMHDYGRSSAPIAQGLVYDINAPHAFGLRESQRVQIFAYSPRTGTRSKCLPNPLGVTLMTEPNHCRRLHDAVSFFFFTTTSR